MEVPIALLVIFATVSLAATETEIKLPNISRCGDHEQEYFECHVDASCLYGEKKRETPMFLRRYYEKFHGKKNLTDCKTVVVVSATPPPFRPNPSQRHRRREYWIERPDKKVRYFNASGWIDKGHHKIGVRFIVGQKIVMLSEDDGFTDDDDFVFGYRHDCHRGKCTSDDDTDSLYSYAFFPVFTARVNQTESEGKIRFELDARAHKGNRHSHYAEVYRPRQHASEETNQELINAGQETTPATMVNDEEIGQDPNNGTHEAHHEEVKPTELEAGEVGREARKATAQSPIFTIVLCVTGAIVTVVVLSGATFVVVQRRRRVAAAKSGQKSEGTQKETQSLISKKETEAKTGIAAADPPFEPSTEAATTGSINAALIEPNSEGGNSDPTSAPRIE